MTHPAHADRPALGIALMTGFCVLAPLGDSIAKFLGQTQPMLQLLVARFLIQALLLAPLVVVSRVPLPRSPRLLRLIALRTVLHIAGIGAMFTGLRFLPLADAIAIAFVMPFLMLALGRLFLNEQVGLHRLSACAVGFAGTLMVIRPNFADVGLAALWPLGVAVTFALFMLVTRMIAKETDPVGLQMLSGVIASALLVPLLVLTGAGLLPGAAPHMPDPAGWALILLLGALGTAAHLLMTWSLRFAPGATLAPMQYLEIPIATLYGWWIFRDFPDGMALAGIAVTVAAGLYVILRERRLHRSAR
ncbi:DMT family transporter [Actibacterium ureilyticum]|uniref:DMT family transporter n=1 Tax=Actibacterium ureilyticum TaxID=1590614 RepID=UPI000BAAE15A|nr:DMT family transporter [Actibacterium ureilyticum]